MNRREIRNRIAYKFSTTVPRVEKYKVGAAVQILETTRFILVRDDLFTTGQPSISVTGHWRILTYPPPSLRTCKFPTDLPSALDLEVCLLLRNFVVMLRLHKRELGFSENYFIFSN